MSAAKETFNGWQVLLLFGLALLAMSIGINKAPLFLEEPRRALVGMEMLFSGDWVHTTIHGEPYYNKPPLFNWVIAIGFKLFGYQEWILRAITIIAHTLIGWMVYALVKKYYSPAAGLLTASVYLSGADMLFYFSLLGEIDIFFSMLIVAAWFALFHFQQQHKPWVAFPLFYIFMALAFLTKGLPAVLFAGLTMLGWVWQQKSWTLLWSKAHLAGCFCFVGIAVLYLIPFMQKGDFNLLMQTFWSQSVERASGDISLTTRLIRMLSFPMLLLKDLLPGIIMLMVFSRKKLLRLIQDSPLVSFCCMVIVVNIWVYWISPDTRSRYHYMFHPLLYIPIVLIYLQQSSHRFYKPLQRIFIILPFIVIALIALAIFLIPVFLKTTGIAWILPVALVLALLALWLSVKYKWQPVYTTVIMLLLMRGAYGYITCAERGQHSNAAADKITGEKIASTVQNGNVFLLDSTRISTTVSFYLQKQLNRQVQFNDQPAPGDYIILPDSVRPEAILPILNFSYQQIPYCLVQWKASIIEP